MWQLNLCRTCVMQQDIDPKHRSKSNTEFHKKRTLVISQSEPSA